ncbi:MAG: nuclear transport factor 2 family protein, partial [Methylocystis sp.]
DEIALGGETVIRAGDDGRIVCIEQVGGAKLVATNWFRRVDSQWLLVHHQASPLAAGPAEARTSTTRH